MALLIFPNPMEVSSVDSYVFFLWLIHLYNRAIFDPNISL